MTFFNLLLLTSKLVAADSPVEAGILLFETALSEETRNNLNDFIKSLLPDEDPLIKAMVADCILECTDHQFDIFFDSLSNEDRFKDRCWTECAAFRKKNYSDEEQGKMYIPFRQACGVLYHELVNDNGVIIRAVERLSVNSDAEFKALYSELQKLTELIKPLQVPPKAPSVVPHSLTKSVPRGECLYRGPELQDLKEMLSKSQRRLILASGFGGVGKTEIAKKLYHDLHDKYAYSGWINYQGDLKNSILIDFLWPEDERPDNRATRIYRFFQENQDEKLLVIDNVYLNNKNDDWLDEISGMDHLTVLITSRQRNITHYMPYDVEFLSKENSINLFIHYYELSGRTYREEQRHTVEALVELVQNHTLSVEILAKSAKSEPNLEGFLDHLVSEGFCYPKLRVKTDYAKESRNMVEYLRKLFDLSKKTEEEIRVLRNFALMPSVEIPSEVKEWINCDDNTLQDLCDSGWLLQKEKPFGYYMHPLIKETILLEKKYRTFPENIGDEFLEFLSKKEKFVKKEETYITVLPKLEIADSVLRELGTRHTEQYMTAWLNLAILFRDFSIYDKSMACFKRVFNILKEMGGTEELRAANIYREYGVLQRKQGKFHSAKSFYIKALRIRENYFSTENLEAATLYNNIGIVYMDLKWYRKAEEYYKRALFIREEKLGTYNFATAGSYNNLGLLYELMGNYQEAEEYSQKALKIKLAVCGETNASTAGSYNNLGDLYLAIKNYDKSLKYHNKALNIRVTVYGQTHCDTAISYNNIGEVYTAQENYCDAIDMFSNAFKIWKGKLEPSHPYVKNVLELMKKIFPHTKYADSRSFETWILDEFNYKI